MFRLVEVFNEMHEHIWKGENTMAKRALLVGINDYKEINDLEAYADS
jgi:hypothetical protein